MEKEFCNVRYKLYDDIRLVRSVSNFEANFRAVELCEAVIRAACVGQRIF